MLQKIPEEYRDRVVLVVEDTRMMRVLMTRHLRQVGFSTVLECENGREALEILAERVVDLILLDIQMPVMDGYQAWRRSRRTSRWPDPVIMITAVDKIESIAKCIEIGPATTCPSCSTPSCSTAASPSAWRSQRLRSELERLGSKPG